eukprot:TRINITY_DN58_c0_g2_i1.p1 TRINITY_DN58_c0_g2~~TRINITY_DN58_c0_g2_i1.p1  ORF type:complete len:374 (+),score=62.05 TRINITY_DN58_c0_g2_i1:343-1464(+)
MVHDAPAAAAAAAAVQSMIKGELFKCCPAAAVVALEASVADSPGSNGSPPSTRLLRSGLSTDQGKRATMEDESVQVDDLLEFFPQIFCHDSERRAFYGVFDGHNGTGASSFVRKHLLRHVIEDPVFPWELSDVFLRAFEQLDLELEQAQEDDSGTTALAALITGSSLLIANLGDCRAVLSRRGRAIDLSTDQRPTHPAEKERIEAAGGYVVVDGGGYLNGILGVARALGDWRMTGLKGRDPGSQRPFGPLSAVPEIRETTLTADDEFLILGCDGLWDEFSSQNAVDFARGRLQEHNSPQQCADEMVKEALKRGTQDNLTVVMVCFGPDPPPPKSPKRSNQPRWQTPGQRWQTPAQRRVVQVDSVVDLQTLGRC